MIYFFPQWQGSFVNNRLYLAANRLRDYLESRFGVKFADIPLAESASPVLADGIIARDAIVKQADIARSVLDKSRLTRVFTIGGDCGIEVMPVTYLNAQYEGKLALVWIDAHGDLNTPQTSPSHTFHGMPLRVILGEGDPALVQLVRRPLRPTQVFLVGVRDLDPAERAYVEQNSVVLIPTVSRETIDNQLIPALRTQGYDNIYIHLDLDAFDPQAFSHIDYPTPGGLTMESAIQSLMALAASFQIVGMSITEYASETGQGLDTLDPLLQFFVEQAA